MKIMATKWQLKGKSLDNMNILVTGGAGVIGSNLVKTIPGNIKVIDNLSSSNLESIGDQIEKRHINFIRGDIRDINLLQEISKGMDLIIHLAANADVRYYEGKETSDDIIINTVGTYNVMEVMRRNDIDYMIFSSSSSVYGLAEKIPTPETYGPLLPESLYAGSKLGAEGIISSFSSIFGFKSFIFRFANIVAPNYRTIGRNVIPDLILKLKENNQTLKILGNGKQRKSYLYVDDCIEGMIHLANVSKKDIDIFNLGNEDSISVDEIAEIIVKEMGVHDVKYNYTGGERGWVGDIPTTILDINKAIKLGWKPSMNSAEAVRKSARTIIEGMKESN